MMCAAMMTVGDVELPWRIFSRGFTGRQIEANQNLSDLLTGSLEGTFYALMMPCAYVDQIIL